jgi:hypothetical protein
MQRYYYNTVLCSAIEGLSRKERTLEEDTDLDLSSISNYLPLSSHVIIVINSVRAWPMDRLYINLV